MIETTDLDDNDRSPALVAGFFFMSASWPFVSVKLSVNVPNHNVGFAPESGRSECAA